MNQILFSFLALLALSGCVSIKKQPLDANRAAELRDSTLTTTQYPKPDFAVLTAGKALFGIAGAFAAISEGNKVLADHNVSDPSIKLSENLAKVLEQRLGTKPVRASVNVTDDDISKISMAASPSAQYVLDIKTFTWLMGYFPTDWTHYRVPFSARARLINAHTKMVVAEGFCMRNVDSNVNAPTYDEMLANGATRLKQEMETITAFCADALQRDMFPTTALATPQLAPSPGANLPNHASPKVSDARTSTPSTIAKPPLSSESPSNTTATATNTQTDQNIAPPQSSPAPADLKGPASPAPMPENIPPVMEAKNVVNLPPATSKEDISKPNNTYLPRSRDIVESAPKKPAAPSEVGTIQLVNFMLGVSSVTVEKLAKSQSCAGGQGAGLVSPKGSRELYKMQCADGKVLMAMCELRQCTVLSHR